MSELRMYPADLNLSPDVIGYQRFLFVHLPPGEADGALADALDGLGKGMENMHDVAGYPSEDACKRGRFPVPAGRAHPQHCTGPPPLGPLERACPHPARRCDA